MTDAQAVANYVDPDGISLDARQRMGGGYRHLEALSAHIAAARRGERCDEPLEERLAQIVRDRIAAEKAGQVVGIDGERYPVLRPGRWPCRECVALRSLSQRAQEEHPRCHDPTHPGRSYICPRCDGTGEAYR